MERKKTLMVITPTLECGGAEKYTATLCNNISPEKFRIVLVVVDNSKPFFKISHHVEIINLGRKRVSLIFIPFRKLIREIKPDIIFSTANHVSLFGALTRNFYGFKSKWIARETSIASVNSQRAKYPFIYRWLLKRSYRKIDLVICQHEAMKDDLIKHFNVPSSKCMVILPGIEVKEFNDGKSPDLVSVGRLSKEKGIDRVLNALEKIKRPFRYVIAGDGEERSSLEQKAGQISNDEQIIEFTGSIEDPVSKYQGALLMLSGSYYEGSPNAVLEANFLGIPVIAFDVPGIRDVIKNGWNGFLVEDGDEEKFSERIEEGLDFNFKREEIAAYTREHFGLKKMIINTEAAILQVLNR